MALFTIWEGPEDGITMKRGPEPPAVVFGPIAKVLEFHAASWNEARQRQYDHYKWGHYEPQDGWEEIGPDEP